MSDHIKGTIDVSVWLSPTPCQGPPAPSPPDLGEARESWHMARAPSISHRHGGWNNPAALCLLSSFSWLLPQASCLGRAIPTKIKICRSAKQKQQEQNPGEALAVWPVEVSPEGLNYINPSSRFQHHIWFSIKMFQMAKETLYRTVSLFQPKYIVSWVLLN